MNTVNLDQNAVLAEIGKIITSSLNIEEVYGQFAELTDTILPHDIISLNLVDWERELYTIAYNHGPETAAREIGIAVPLAGSMTRRVANSLNGILMNLSDYEFVKENIPGTLPLTMAGYKSAIGVPLKGNAKAHAMLMLASREASAYDDEDLKLAQKIGSQIAGAIANAQLHLQLSNSAIERDVLAEISRILTSSLNIDEVFAEFAELIRPTIPFDRISMWEIDGSRPGGGILHALGVEIPRLTSGSIPPPQNDKFRDMIVNRSTLLIPDESAPDYANSDPVTALTVATGFRSLLAVPLVSRDRVIGLLTFRSRTSHLYTNHHLAVAQRISDQIGGAIAINQMHRISEGDGQERRVLAEISRTLTSSLDIDEVFAEFAELIRPTIPFDRIAMWEIDESKPHGGILHALGVEIPSLADGSIPPPNDDKFRDMISNRSPLLISDESAEEATNSDPITALAVSTGFRSLLAVPMVSRDRVIGLLTFRSRTSHLYTNHHLSVAQRISDQIGGAIAINQMHRESEREGQERRVLAEISRTLTSSLDFDEIWVEFAVSIRSLIPFDRTALWEIDESRPDGGTSHSFGMEIPGVGPGTPPVTADSKFQDLISDRSTLRDPDEALGEDALSDPLVAMPVAEGFRSLLAIPVVARDQVIGILSFRSRTPGLYTERHQALAERISDQISGPVAINQMHRVSEREGHERQILAEISRVVSSSPKVSEVYDKFADLVASIISLDRISIGLIDEEKGEFSQLYSAGVQVDGVGHGSGPEQFTGSLAGTLASEALVSKSPIIISECDRDKLKERFPGLMRGFDAGLRHWLGVPLVAEGSVLGIMRIASKTYQYNEHDASTAERIAAQIVGTIANAKLHDDLTRESAERQALAEISRIVSSDADMDDIFGSFSELLGEMINFDQLSIAIPDTNEGTLSYVFRIGENLPGQGAKGPYPSKNSATLEVIRTQNSMIVDLLSEQWVSTNIAGLLPAYRHGVHTMIAAPLISDGEAFGALLLASFQEKAYDSHDLELVDRVGAQIAGALANSNLRLELEREATERKALAELGRIMSSSLILSDVYERFADQLTRIVDFDWLILASVDLETWSATQLYYSGAGEGPLRDGQTVSMTDSQGGESVRQRKTLLFHPSSRSEVAAAYSTLVQAFDEGFRSYLTAPLISSDTVVGVITLRSKTANAYDSRDAVLIEQVCNQIAGAFASGELHQELERESHEREVLAELGRVISSSPNIENVYDEFAELANKIVPFDRLVIGTIDHEAWIGTVAYVAGMRYASLEPGDTIPLANTQVGEVIKNRSAGIVHALDLQEMSEQYPRLGDLYNSGLQSYLAVPLISSDIVTGVLTFRSLAADVYTERELDLAERIALQIAGAISNAQLFAVQEREAREKEVLAKIGRVIASSLNIDDVFERFATEVGKILEFDRISIVAVNQDRETASSLFSSGFVVPNRAPGSEWPLNGTLSYEVAKSNSPILIDIEIDTDWIERFPELQDSVEVGTRSFLTAPLVSNDENIGVLHLKSHQSDIYGKNEIALLQRITTQIAGAIANLFLYTELRDTSIALNESQGQWDSLVSNTPDLIVILDPEGTIQFINRAPVGQETYSMVGTSIYEFVTEPYYDTVSSTLALVLESGAPSSYEIANIPGRDESLTFNCRVGPIKQDGKTVALSVIATDVTERKQAERALIESEGRTRAIFDGAGIEICLLDASANLIAANPSFLEILGYTQEELTSIGYLGLVHPDDHEESARLYDEWIKGDRDQFDADIRFCHKAGHIVWTRTTLTMHQLDPQSEPLLIAMIEGVTERRQLEEQLLQSQRLEAVGQLAGGVAHDFNNLLTAIIGFAHLGSFQVHEEHPVYRYFNDILTAGERAARLTRQLLTFSHSDITEPVDLDLNDVITETNRMLRPIIGENIELNTLLAPNLGKIAIDPTHVEQLLVNLAVNASDAMPNGGKLWIETDRQTIDEVSALQNTELSSGNYVVLTVRDSGEGMTDEVKNKIFEPFFTTKEVGKGTGLGLATCYGIVTKAGGHITVDTQPGEGSSFHAYFPIVDGSEPVDSQAESETQDIVSGYETILLVEDEALVRDACAIALRRQGYEVLEASNGTEALRIVEEHTESKIDLLMTDVIMPFMGGVELSKQVVNAIPEVKVLFASGYSDDQALKEGLITKNHHFIQKPFTPFMLTNSVRDILDN